MAEVLIVGSVAYDTVESAAGKAERALGGAAVYAGLAASFYCRPALVGVVGEDFKQEHISLLKSRGLDLSGLEVKPGKTFHWSGRYLPDMIGRETLETSLNVFEDFNPQLDPDQTRAQWVFLANIHPELQARVLDQVENPRLVVMDTMNLWINTAREDLENLLPRVDVLVLNDEEARMLMEDYNLARAAKGLLRKVRKAVIIKRGEHGSSLFCGEECAFSPAFPVENLVDPTGAGDSFAGAFIGFLAAEGSAETPAMRKALLHASALASFTVESFSVDRLVSISREDIEARVAALKDFTRFD